MEDGIIELDSDRAKEFDFTSEKYDGYLWKQDNHITISFIVCKTSGQGHFRDLVNTILGKGYSVQVPTPSARMSDILSKNGFKQSFEFDENFGESVELWVRKPS